MRFSPSTYLVMCLYLKTLTSMLWTLTYSGGTDRHGELSYLKGPYWDGLRDHLRDVP